MSEIRLLRTLSMLAPALVLALAVATATPARATEPSKQVCLIRCTTGYCYGPCPAEAVASVGAQVVDAFVGWISGKRFTW